MSMSDLVPLRRRSAAGAPAPARSDDDAAARPRRLAYVETYGCQMNVADTEMVLGLLHGAGYGRTEDPARADLILLNTCAVREKAEEKVYARASMLAAHKARPGVVLGITGCMAEHLKGAIRQQAPYVDVVVGPDGYRRLLDHVERARGGEAVEDTQLDRFETYEGLDPARARGSAVEDGSGGAVTGHITIQRGCDKFCTFCVVPFTRGRERGTPPREVLRQVREHAAAGYREVVLLGQTVNSYVYEDVTFAQLLRAVAKIDGLERIRFTSPYPVDFTDDVVAALADEPKICKYVHLPVQSGSDVVLDRMRRGYSVADYRDIVRRLRAAMPDIALSTDILSGFSGETADDHARTLDLMREIRFDSSFMFAYSERDLTFAAKKLPDDVAPDVKARRLAEIVALQESISAEVFAAQVGKHERVLVHGPSKRDPAQLMGRTDGFKTVILPAGVGAVGELVDVTIRRATMATLFA